MKSNQQYEKSVENEILFSGLCDCVCFSSTIAVKQKSMSWRRKFSSQVKDQFPIDPTLLTH